jgi:hypothetical protein
VILHEVNVTEIKLVEADQAVLEEAFVLQGDRDLAILCLLLLGCSGFSFFFLLLFFLFGFKFLIFSCGFSLCSEFFYLMLFR